MSASSNGDEASGRVGMIANDRSVPRHPRGRARVEDGLARLDETEAHRPPEMRALMRAAMESQLDDLRQQLAEYDALRSCQVRVLEMDSLDDLPEVLIRARNAAGLTQMKLPERLGIRESQLQRYEATGAIWTAPNRSTNLSNAPADTPLRTLAGVLRAVLPRRYWSHADLRHWLAQTQRRNARATTSHTKRRQLTLHELSLSY